MDFRQLKSFVKIVEQGSMSRASVELNIVQSALSLQISTLETRLRQQLLIRRSTGVTPTEAGKTLYRHAVAILRQVERASLDVERSSAYAAGPASLGLPVVVQDLLATDLLVAAREELPQVKLHLAEGMSYFLKEMVLHGRLDMTVTYQFDPSPGITEHPLFTEEIYLVSPLASGIVDADGALPIEDVLRWPLFLSSPQTGMRRMIESKLAEMGLKVDALAEVDSLRTLIDVAEKGIAHTILPASALQKQLHDPSGRSVVLNALNLSRTVVLCTSEHLPIGAAATAVYGLLIKLVDDAIAAGRWKSISSPNDVSSCRTKAPSAH